MSDARTLIRRTTMSRKVMTELMVEEEMAKKIEILQHWMQRWAGSMGADAALLEKELGHKAKSSEGSRVSTNLMAGEDDSEVYYSSVDTAKLATLSTMIDNLQRQQPWTYWAFATAHGLMRRSCWKYPGLPIEEAYTNALEELQLLIDDAGIVL